ncbi:hypothetical protein AGOR_G00218240 [Albula goreensis]|uniref:Very-long-chain (3R)-3-hydroxyacyl-CoA dehydratase n=1 Tax=Albula goreensis TaxID=1534307 RepID=A0A8T3CMR0_9TELE|nr:hypothetical protein AGOR_G00218240 [Albula goreensis]
MSWVAGYCCGAGTGISCKRQLPWPVLLHREASEVLPNWSAPGDITLRCWYCTIISGPDRIPGDVSRVLTWAVTHSVREVQNEDSVLLFVVAWTITEIIRYSFYTFSLLNHLPYLIKWARYTLFIVLYPMGVTGELLTIYAALPYVQKTGLYSVTLPNKYNFSFDYHTFLILTMVSYIPLFPQLYFHMLRQRKKVLGHVEDYSKVE